MRKPSPAMLVALVALFSSLTGGATAATVLKANSVHSKQIAPRSVQLSDLAMNARPGAISKARAASVVQDVISDPNYNLKITVAGEKGEKGDPGASVSGPQGAAGAPGADGIPVVNLRTAQIDVSPGSSGQAAAQCAAGEKVTGGGEQMDGAPQVVTSGPAGTDAWVATVTNQDAVPRTLTVTAICTVVR